MDFHPQFGAPFRHPLPFSRIILLLQKGFSHSLFFFKKNFLFSSFHLSRKRDQRPLSVKGSIYKILEKSKTISLVKISLSTQFSIIGLLCCYKCHRNLYFNSTRQFLCSLTYNYSSVYLQKKTSIPPEFFLKLKYTKFNGKSK